MFIYLSRDFESYTVFLALAGSLFLLWGQRSGQNNSQGTECDVEVEDQKVEFAHPGTSGFAPDQASFLLPRTRRPRFVVRCTGGGHGARGHVGVCDDRTWVSALAEHDEQLQ